MDYIFKSISDAKEMIERKPNQSTVDYKIYGVLTDCETTIKALHKAINGFTMNAVPVVRCKDCKYAEILNWLDDAIICKKHSYTGVRPEEFFCADGERKEGNMDA